MKKAEALDQFKEWFEWYWEYRDDGCIELPTILEAIELSKTEDGLKQLKKEIKQGYRK